MDQVVGGLDALKGVVEAPGLEEVALVDGDAVGWVVAVGVPDQHADVVARIEEFRDEAGADEAGGAGDEDVCQVRGYPFYANFVPMFSSDCKLQI